MPNLAEPGFPSRPGPWLLALVLAAVPVRAGEPFRSVEAVADADFREPDSVRLGLSPLTTRFVDDHEGLAALAEHLPERATRKGPQEPQPGHR